MRWHSSATSRCSSGTVLFTRRSNHSLPSARHERGRRMADPSPLTMPIEEAMRTQRALRRLRPDPVDDALVLRLIALALKAPTGRNAQHWEFVLVKDRLVKARLARAYRIAWGLYGRLGRRLTAGD